MGQGNDTKNLNDLFDLIRKEDVVLFVGAGVSRCVGLPSGADLSEYIYNLLPEKIQEAAERHKYNLQEISSQYIYANGKGGRENLINIIQSMFEGKYPSFTSNTPLSVLAKAPHFKYIVTTNYDTLLENSIGYDSCVVVGNNKEVPNAGNNKNKTVLIKIHGDFNNKKNIVLTKEDYNELYCTGKMDTPIWGLLKSLFSTKSLLFIGYSLNDGNIDSILSYINKYTKSNKKRYFISKDISCEKLSELKAKRFVPLEMDFETFFMKYISVFNETIVEDFNSNSTSYETTKRYLGHIIPIMDRGKIIDLKPESNNDKIKITFKFNDMDSFIKLKDFDSFDPININDITDFSYKVAGITLPFGGISKIEISRNPNKEFMTLIYFFESNFEIRDIPTKSYFGENKFRVIFKIKGGEVILESVRSANNEKNNTTIEFKQNQDNISVPAAIQWYTLLENLRLARRFRIKTSLGFEYITSLKTSDPFIENETFKTSLDYMSSLHIIEKYFSINFSGNINPTNQDRQKTDLIIRNIKGNLFSNFDSDCEFKVTQVTTDKETSTCLMCRKENKFTIIEKKHLLINLHGEKIDLGYWMFEVIDPELISEKDLGANGIEIVIKAHKGKYKAIYQSKSPDDFLKTWNLTIR